MRVTSDSSEQGSSTYIPELGPANQVGVVYAALGVDVLARPDHHGLVRRDVGERRIARIGMGHPYGDGEAVRRPPKDDGDGSREVDEEGGDAIVECVDIGARRQRRVLREGLGYVVVGPLDIVIFLWWASTSALGSRWAVGAPTLVRTLYSQFSTCCWTTILSCRSPS